MTDRNLNLDGLPLLQDIQRLAAQYSGDDDDPHMSTLKMRELRQLVEREKDAAYHQGLVDSEHLDEPLPNWAKLIMLRAKTRDSVVYKALTPEQRKEIES